MAKSAITPDESLLAGLKKAFQSLPKSMLLNGKDGIFPGGAAGKELARNAIEGGYLIETKVSVLGGGKKPKTTMVPHGQLTDAGIKRVIEADSPKAALEGLLAGVRSLGQQDRPNVDTFRAELARASQECVAVIRDGFARIDETIQKAMAPPTVGSPDLILSALQQALARVSAPSIPAIAPTAVLMPCSTQELETAITKFVTGVYRDRAVGCQFDVVWEHLKKQFPELTIGMFQDALRKLYDSQTIRLGGWPRMLDDLPQPQLALFVSSKVMYYVHPAQSTN